MNEKDHSIGVPLPPTDLEPITRAEAGEIGDLGNDGDDDLDEDLLATARRAEKLLNSDEPKC